MSEFIQKNESIRVAKADKDVTNRDPMVRLYCESRDRNWNLQVRGPQGIGGSGIRVGKAYMIATARLDRDELIALRDAINEELGKKSRFAVRGVLGGYEVTGTGGAVIAKIMENADNDDARDLASMIRHGQ